MAGRYAKAELLAALWRLGNAPEERLPISHGILDRVLKDCLNELPKELTRIMRRGLAGVA